MSLAAVQALIYSNVHVVPDFFFLVSPDSVLFSEPKGYVAASCVFPLFLPLVFQGQKTRGNVLVSASSLVLQTHGTKVEKQDPAACS